MLSCFTFVGCSQESQVEINEPTEKVAESLPEANANPKIIMLELNGEEELNIFKKAVSDSRKDSGIVNIVNPQYQFSIGGDTYFLWISENSGVIMNTKDTHSISLLSSSSIKEVYELINKG